MLFIVEAVALGCILKYAKLNKWVNTAIAIVMLVAAVAFTLFPNVSDKRDMAYLDLYLHSDCQVAPVTMLLQPRDYLPTVTC